MQYKWKFVVKKQSKNLFQNYELYIGKQKRTIC